MWVDDWVCTNKRDVRYVLVCVCICIYVYKHTHMRERDPALLGEARGHCMKRSKLVAGEQILPTVPLDNVPYVELRRRKWHGECQGWAGDSESLQRSGTMLQTLTLNSDLLFRYLRG